METHIHWYFQSIFLWNATFFILTFRENGTLWSPFDNSVFIYKLTYIKKVKQERKRMLRKLQIKQNIPAQ